MASGIPLHAQPNERGRSTAQEWIAGLSRAMPIVVGYIPVGLAFGVLAQKAGISPLNTMLMSLLVYAGASQFIAVGLFAVGVPAWSVILTTLIVNLRHMLMSAALSPFLKQWHPSEQAAFAFQITDETFAVHSQDLSLGAMRKARAFAIHITAQASWVLGTWLGTVTGQRITDVKPFALDYALPSMFVALLILQIRDRIQALVALLSGIAAVGLLLAGMERWSVIAATLVGATIGVGVERWTKRRSPGP
jgi:4-azaleucine resistance transporter AzlC